MYEDNNYLAHYGVKGMKWGVRRTPEQLGHTTRSKKDNPTIESIKTGWGERKKITYDNKSKTAEKKILDQMAKDQDYYNAEKFDYEFTKYAKNFREKGEEYANKMLHENLKNYSYTFMIDNEDLGDGETYTLYMLKVIGDKGYYVAFGEEGYSDEQYFVYKD